MGTQAKKVSVPTVSEFFFFLPSDKNVIFNQSTNYFLWASVQCNWNQLLLNEIIITERRIKTKF